VRHAARGAAQERARPSSMSKLEREMARLRQQMGAIHTQQAHTETQSVVSSVWQPHTSTLCDTSTKQENGYIDVGEALDKHVFYWFFESRRSPAKDPLLIYLNGGPGCSSMFAIFRENGPCRVTKDGGSTVFNPYSWTEFANVLWIDQPIWVGFSYSDDPIRDHDEADVEHDMYQFLQSWLKTHPQYQQHDFIVSGESYAGHYIPVISHRILQGNNNLRLGDVHINLRGVSIGNGCSNPSVQVKYFTEFADGAFQQYGIKVFADDVEQRVNDEIGVCVKLLDECQANSPDLAHDDQKVCSDAQRQCSLITMNTFMKGGRNIYDIRKPCSYRPFCYSFGDVTAYLGKPHVRAALGIPTKVAPWQVCNLKVNADFRADWSRDCMSLLRPILEAGIPVLNYAGDADYICNWAGNKAATMELKWNGQAEFVQAKDQIWHDPQSKLKLGEVRAARGLTNMRLYNSGHMVSMDQPKTALLMMTMWLDGKLGASEIATENTEAR